MASKPMVTPSRSGCGGHCGCDKCAAGEARRYQHQRIKRILYEVRMIGHKKNKRVIYESLEQKSTDDPVGKYYGGWTPQWKDQVTPAEFIAARNRSTRPGFHSPLEESDLTGHKLFLSHDSTVGGALSPEGDMQNAFNNGGPKGAYVELAIERLRHGGRTLDAFDDYLPKLYSQFGLKETGRVPFNREYAPKNWDYDKHGEPDVVFMARDPKEPIDADAIRQRVLNKANWQPHAKTGNYFQDWDEAKAHSRRGGVPGTHGAPGGAGSGVEAVATPPGQREGNRGSVDVAAQAHQQSLTRRDYAKKDSHDDSLSSKVAALEANPEKNQAVGIMKLIEIATQGHMHSLKPKSVVRGVARQSYDRTSPIKKQAHLDVLNRVRQKNSAKS